MHVREASTLLTTWFSPFAVTISVSVPPFPVAVIVAVPTISILVAIVVPVTSVPIAWHNDTLIIPVVLGLHVDIHIGREFGVRKAKSDTE